MFLKKIEVDNFRLLKDFEINLNTNLSMIIGKNNSGKTSVLFALEKILNSKSIVWEDINLDRQKEIYEEIKNINTAEGVNSQRIKAICLRLYIEYNDKDSYRNIQKFMMDLNPNNNNIVLEFILLIPSEQITTLKKVIAEKSISDFQTFSRYIRKNFKSFFRLTKHSRGFDINKNQLRDDISEEIESKDIEKLIKIVGVRADRSVSNDNSNNSLSKLTGKYYSAYKNSKQEENNRSKETVSKLEEAVDKADKELYDIYNGKHNSEGVFGDLKEIIKKYGGTNDGINISIESSISEKNLLTDNTHLSYRQGEDHSLPETYNGLGYLNLIGILFEVETKLQELHERPADINILYVEEPEAHTHPQLQYIFIRNIKAHINQHREEFKDEKYLQTLITSHSSHIVSECDFDDIIYLKKVENGISAKSFNYLKQAYGGDDTKSFKFVKQYLTLNRSELFFADKVICIEGDTERILMPRMMEKIDNSEKNNIPLISQNISIIEVGAYSHIFMPLFEFLSIQVLIITDIDPARKNSNGLSKCKPNMATHTINASIKNFFGDKLSENENQFQELKNKKYNEKLKNNIRITYQIPEQNGNKYQASSFEDAFIALNKDFILRNSKAFYDFGALKNFKKINSEVIKNEDYYEFASNNIAKKTSFAASILYFEDENNTWQVPHYIKEGLLWIQSN